MSNPWFRMYSEFAHDPKVQMMTEQMQRRYVMLMCLRCSNVLVTLHETEIAFHFRISNEELAETKALFIAKKFIDDAWSVLNWDKRQFVSDSSAARVAKHRAKKTKQSNTDVTLHETKSNTLDTDTDTDKTLTALSGKPDHPPLSKSINGFRPDALSALAFLNEKTGRNYKPVDSNLRMIAARLKEGASLEDLRSVIAKKCREWGTDPKMEQFLRPKTLFNATNFANYEGELYREVSHD